MEKWLRTLAAALLLAGVAALSQAQNVFTSPPIGLPSASGDFTCTGAGSCTVANNAISNAKTAQMVTSSIKCRTTAGTGNPEDCTGAQAATIAGVTTVGTAAVGQLPGTTTNDAAAAGKVGEYVSSSVLVGSAVSLTTSTAKTITSISLTAGDWDISSNISFTGGGTTLVTILRGEISPTDNTENTANGFFSNFVSASGVAIFAQDDVHFTTGPVRVSLASTTTYYLVARAFFTVSTCSGYGILQARRMR